MSFFNTFSDISRNGGNFRQWEQDKADEEAKRKQYFAQNPASKEQLKEAAEFGRVVVDTVDLMDAQSENKSESVEMVTETTTGVASGLAFFASFFGLSKIFSKRYREISGSLSKLDELTDKLNISGETKNSAELQEIVDDLRKHNLLNPRVKDRVALKNGIGGVNLLYKENWAKISEKTKAYFSSVVDSKLIEKAGKNRNNFTKIMAIPAIVSFGVAVAGQLSGTIMQLKASKIARFQAREDLEANGNFIEYTDEQKAEAKKHLNEVKVPEDKKSGSLRDLLSLGKDYGRYKAVSKQLDNTHLKDIQEPEPEKAYGRQEVINDCIRKINNEAEDYSENMETTAQVLLGSSVLGGALFGKIASLIINKIDKAKPQVEKLGKDFSELKLGGKLLAAARKNPTMAGMLLSTIITAPFATKLQKEASRAGRYKAKRDLEENPENFIYVNKGELNSIQAKGEIKKEGILDALKFIPEAIRTVRDYDKYKKTTLKEKKAMQEALKRVETTDEQKKKGEALKVRLYKSFDTIDDHSEEYSEKMEAACEISKGVLNLAQTVGMIAPLVVLAKYPHKFVKPTTGILAGAFKRLGGFAKKYTIGIGEHITKKLNKKVERTYAFERMGIAEKEINEALTTTDDAQFEQKLQAIGKTLKTKWGEFGAEMHLQQIKDYRKIALEKASAELTIPDKSIEDVLKMAGLDLVESKENIDRWRTALTEMAGTLGAPEKGFKGMTDEKIKKIMADMKMISQTIPQKELKESLMQRLKFEKENPLRAMICHNENIDLSAKETFLTKDILPIIYGVGGVWVAGMISASYAIESYLSGQTKKAGRLGTMKAIEELNKENEQAKKSKA